MPVALEFAWKVAHEVFAMTCVLMAEYSWTAHTASYALILDLHIVDIIAVFFCDSYTQ